MLLVVHLLKKFFYFCCRMKTEGQFTVECSFSLSQNHVYGQELVLFSSCCTLLCIYYSFNVNALSFCFCLFLYRVKVATLGFGPSTKIDRSIYRSSAIRDPHLLITKSELK